MKRYLYAIFIVLFALSACKDPIPEPVKKGLSVSPENVEMDYKGGSQILTIKADKPWEIEILEGEEWCIPARLNGKFSTSLNVTVSKNIGQERTARLKFTAGDFEPVTVTFLQGAFGVVDMEEVDPDPASGITVEPKRPDADGSCVITFKPTATSEMSSELFNADSDLYMHIGLFAEDDWTHVVSDWNVNDDKYKMTKVAANHYTLEVGPTIREYFNSGTDPVVRIAMVVRNADGSKQTRPDQFVSVTDTKYTYIPFAPHPVVEEAMPSGLVHGINYNNDGSVSLVFYEKDKNGGRYDYAYVIGEFSEWKREQEYMMKRDEAAGCWWYTFPASSINPDKEYLFQYHLGKGKDNKRFIDPYTEIVYDQWNDQYITSSTYPNLTPYPEGTKDHVAAFQVNRPTYTWQHPNFKIADKNDLVIYELLLRDFTETRDLVGAMSKLDYLENLGITAIELMPVQEFDGNLSWGYNPFAYFAMDKAYGSREIYKQFIDECHGRGIAVIFDVVYNHLTGASPWAKLYWDVENNRPLPINPWFNVTAPHQFSVFEDLNHENQMVRDHVKRNLKYLLQEYKIDGFRFDLSKGFTQNSYKESSYDQSRVDILKDYNNTIKATNPNAVVILEHFVDPENVELGNAGMKVWRNANSTYIASASSGGNANFGFIREGYEPFGTFVSYMESHDEERMGYVQTTTMGGGSAVSWGIVGTHNNWGAAGDDISLTVDGKFHSAKNVSFAAGEVFKIRKFNDNTWNNAYNYGASTENYQIPVGASGYSLTLGAASKNMKAPAGTYDVYFSSDAKKIWLITVGGQRPANPPISTDSALELRMRRLGCNAAFFLTVPGPKMIWQFGELGYDYSIEDGGRTSEKPIRWDYFEVPERKALYDTYADLLRFRKENPRFYDMDAGFEWYVSNSHFPGKYIFGAVDGKRFAVIGNFGAGNQNISVTLPEGGTWYNYFKRSEQYNGTNHNFNMKEGEFKLLVNY